MTVAYYILGALSAVVVLYVVAAAVLRRMADRAICGEGET